MSGESEGVETKEPIGHEIPDERIQRLIAERARNGVKCRVVTENGQRFLVCLSPPL